MLISLTVGKVDAGVAVLLTEDKRLVGRKIICCANAKKILNLDRIPLYTSSSFNLVREYC